MEQQMKIDSSVLKDLRDRRGWSQEHLAQTSGVSLRTIQRIEAEGAASAESKMAIAAALGVTSEELTPKNRHVPRPPAMHIGVKLGFAAAALGTISGVVGVVTGHNSPHEAGMALGIIGALSGLSFGSIGFLSQRIARP